MGKLTIIKANNHSTDHLKIHSFMGDTLRKDVLASEAVVESILWKEDAAMLVGSEKAGKSILALQLCMSIISGEDFLGKYPVKKTGPVVYIQCEGKRNQFIDRLNKMSIAYEIDDSQFLHIYKRYLPLTVEEMKFGVFVAIDEAIKKWGQPPVAIVIDSVYKAMTGDITENEPCRTFTNVVDEFIARYGAGLLLIHHESKEQYDPSMGYQLVERGDRGTYGSVFLRAYVDHILFLKKGKDKARTLFCDTERSGSVLKEREELILLEPTPLILVPKQFDKASIETTLYQLQNHPNGLTYTELNKITGLAIPTLRNAMVLLSQKHPVDKSVGKEKIFKLI